MRTHIYYQYIDNKTYDIQNFKLSIYAFNLIGYKEFYIGRNKNILFFQLPVNE